MNYFNNGNNNNDDDDNDEDNNRDLGNDDNAHSNANKGGKQFIASCLSGRDYCSKCFNFRIVSMYKLIYIIEHRN